MGIFDYVKSTGKNAGKKATHEVATKADTVFGQIGNFVSDGVSKVGSAVKSGLKHASYALGKQMLAPVTAHNSTTQSETSEKKIEDTYRTIKDRLSYGVLDWAITDGDVSAVLRTLDGLSDNERQAVLSKMTDEQKKRLTENLKPEQYHYTDTYGLPKPDTNYAVTENCGVVDRGHENPKGARDLIAAVKQANEDFANLDGGTGLGAGHEFSTPDMSSGDWGIKINQVNLTIRLKKPLTDDQVLGVALYIFKQQSQVFEAEQEGFLNRFSKSSYSGEDLPSNLLSFYRAAYDLSEDDLMKACKEDVSLRTNDKPTMATNEDFRPVDLASDKPFPPADIPEIAEIEPGELYEIVSAPTVGSDGRTGANNDSTSSERLQVNDFGAAVTKRQYVVKSGDSLWKIAERVLGDGNRWPELQKHNQIANPNQIVPGQVLVIPDPKSS